MWTKIQVTTLHLFPILDNQLITLLQSLTPEEWECPTIAKLWKVKDVASHLLDGNLRGLSTSRDAYFGEKPDNIHSYQDLLNFLNGLNMTWTSATRRLSPQIITQLLAVTNKAYYEHLQTLQPFEEAIFSVAWAGQQTSPNWLHIAREYTEKFLHQQQIREAVGKSGMMTKELFYPFINTLMYAFPYAFREVQATAGTRVCIEISTTIGGVWGITKTTTSWELDHTQDLDAHAKVVIPPEVAWKLFSKSWTPEQARQQVQVIGDVELAQQALRIVAFMA